MRQGSFLSDLLVDPKTNGIHFRRSQTRNQPFPPSILASSLKHRRSQTVLLSEWLQCTCRQAFDIQSSKLNSEATGHCSLSDNDTQWYTHQSTAIPCPSFTPGSFASSNQGSITGGLGNNTPLKTATRTAVLASCTWQDFDPGPREQRVELRCMHPPSHLWSIITAND